MRRRQFIALLGGAAIWPLATCIGFAQISPKKTLIGFLGPGSKAANGRYYSGLPLGMGELGYVEGRDYVLAYRYADSDVTRLPSLAEELVRLKPDVIVASTSAAALAVKQATAGIPIVGINLIEPVKMGLVISEARPGTNVTGTVIKLEGLSGKQVEIAHDLVPGVTKIGLLVNPNNPSTAPQRRDVDTAAAALGVTLAPVEVRSADEVGPAFQALLRERVDIVLILGDFLFLAVRRQTAAFALVSRLPTVCNWREEVEDGCLIGYGIDLRAAYQRGAYYVDRILKGEKPGDLPIEFPTKMQLLINLATAKALGLTVPDTLLARADEVIE
jgi:putative ABC transport system substrate-binding protein